MAEVLRIRLWGTLCHDVLSQLIDVIYLSNTRLCRITHSWHTTPGWHQPDTNQTPDQCDLVRASLAAFVIVLSAWQLYLFLAYYHQPPYKWICHCAECRAAVLIIILLPSTTIQMHLSLYWVQGSCTCYYLTAIKCICHCAECRAAVPTCF